MNLPSLSKLTLPKLTFIIPLVGSSSPPKGTLLTLKRRTTYKDVAQSAL
jgi:hypothetical protein